MGRDMGMQETRRAFRDQGKSAHPKPVAPAIPDKLGSGKLIGPIVQKTRNIRPARIFPVPAGQPLPVK